MVGSSVPRVVRGHRCGYGPPQGSPSREWAVWRRGGRMFDPAVHREGGARLAQPGPSPRWRTERPELWSRATMKDIKAISQMEVIPVQFGVENKHLTAPGWEHQEPAAPRGEPMAGRFRIRSGDRPVPWSNCGPRSRRLASIEHGDRPGASSYDRTGATFRGIRGLCRAIASRPVILGAGFALMPPDFPGPGAYNGTFRKKGAVRRATGRAAHFDADRSSCPDRDVCDICYYALRVSREGTRPSVDEAE